MSDNSGLILAAMHETRPLLTVSLDIDNSFLHWIQELGMRVALYRDYERGKHRAGITNQMRKMLRLPDAAVSAGLSDFNDNYMQIVVDKMAGRLHVSEISTGDPANDENWLNPLLQSNKWEALQGTVFRGAIRDGDSYVMINPLTLQWTSEPAFDGFSGLFALFQNNMDTPYWACKIWAEASSVEEAEVMRIVVYEPDRISYWRGLDGGKEIMPDMIVPVVAEGTVEIPVDTIFTNMIPWPLEELPIVHFVNKFDNYSDFGESEMRPAIPLQDVLNRTLHSMVMASEFSAFNVLWSIGMEIDSAGITPGAIINLVLRDGTGKIVTTPTPEMIAFLGAVRVGQFSSSDISQYTNQIDKIVREISQATQTPIYGITNQGAVSGEALKQLEIGLIGKCERFQHQNTDAVRSLVGLTAQLQNEFKNELPAAPTLEQVNVAWKSPEILDVTAQVTALVNMRRDAPGLWDDTFYQAKIGGLLGMNQTEIKKEGDKALVTNGANLDRLVGSGGNVPVA